MTNEAFARVKIDAQLTDQGWDMLDTNAVRFEYVLPDGTTRRLRALRPPRPLAGRHRGQALLDQPGRAEAQAKAYAQQLERAVRLPRPTARRSGSGSGSARPIPRPVKTFFKQDDLERRVATRAVRRDPLSVAIDRHIVERDYQIECIDTLCREIDLGRRKLLVEMATGTGKTRMAAAFIKRLFEANAITRVLFLVDRIPLAKQTEDAFAEHLPDYPAYVLRAGRRFQDEKRITITTLQSMVNIYARVLGGLLRSRHHRRVPPQHLRQVERRAQALRRRADRPDRDALRRRRRGLRRRRGQALRARHAALLRGRHADLHATSSRTPSATAISSRTRSTRRKTVKTAAEGGFEVKRDELDWSAMDADTRAEFEQLFGDERHASPSIRPRWSARFTIPERNRAIVREFREVLEKGYTDAKGVLRKPLLGKTIVFAVTKRHAETLAQLFDAAFADQKPSPEIRYADYVVSGHGRRTTRSTA